jgi:hypothetical protein
VSSAAWLAFPGARAFAFISRDDGLIVTLPFSKAAAIVTGDLPVRHEPGDFSFIIEELKRRRVPVLRMTVRDRAGLLLRYYPPAAFNEMMVDGALREGIRFADVTADESPLGAEAPLQVILHEPGDALRRERSFLDAGHPGERPDVITRPSSKGPLITLIIYPCALAGGHR